MKITKIGIIISLLVFIAVILGISYLTKPQGSLEFALAPSEITMTIDNKSQTVKHEQTLRLAPGTYKAEFSSEGFETKKKTIVIEDNKKGRFVLALTPLTDAAKKKIADNPESSAVINEYKKVRYDELLATLPLSGVNYEISRCPSVKNPKNDIDAICISTDTVAGETAALAAIRQLDYDTSELELLIGSETQKLILESSAYRIDYYINVSQEHSDKPALFITPLNVPYVSYDEPFNPQLETIKSDALKALAENGYTVEEYDVFYSNIYLSKYNAHADEPDEHAMPPII